MKRTAVILVLSLIAVAPRGASRAGPSSSTIEHFLMPGTPTEIVAATKTERIASTAYEHGLRTPYAWKLDEATKPALGDQTAGDRPLLHDAAFTGGDTLAF